MLRVHHREDRLLQKNNAQPLEEHLKGTWIELRTKPTHQALEQFLEEQFIGRDFKDEDEIRFALAGWEQFALSKGVKEENNLFPRGFLIHPEGHICSRDHGPGGPFWLASIEQQGTHPQTTANAVPADR